MMQQVNNDVFRGIKNGTKLIINQTIARISKTHIIPLNERNKILNLLEQIVECRCMLCSRTLKKLSDIFGKRKSHNRLHKYIQDVINACPDGNPMGFETLKLRGLVCYKHDRLLDMQGVLFSNDF